VGKSFGKKIVYLFEFKFNNVKGYGNDAYNCPWVEGDDSYLSIETLNMVLLWYGTWAGIRVRGGVCTVCPVSALIGF
jgi:hypothetical protein